MSVISAIKGVFSSNTTKRMSKETMNKYVKISNTVNMPDVYSAQDILANYAKANKCELFISQNKTSNIPNKDILYIALVKDGKNKGEKFLNTNSSNDKASFLKTLYSTVSSLVVNSKNKIKAISNNKKTVAPNIQNYTKNSYDTYSVGRKQYETLPKQQQERMLLAEQARQNYNKKGPYYIPVKDTAINTYLRFRVCAENVLKNLRQKPNT